MDNSFKKKKLKSFSALTFGSLSLIGVIGLLNYRLSQKFKLLGNGEFNHLTISLTLPLTCGPKLPLNK